MGKNWKAFIKFLAASMFCLAFLAACGGKEDGQSEGQPEGGQFPGGEPGQQLDVVRDENEFPDVAAQLNGGTFLGMQFYKGEPVQLWASEESKGVVSVYLYRKDGTRDTVVESIDLAQTRSRGYLDEQGNYYGIAGNTVTKTDVSGKVLFSVAAGAGNYNSIEEICSTPGGKTAILAQIEDPETSYMNMTLMGLGQNGELKKVEQEDDGKYAARKLPSMTAHLGTWGEDLLLMDGDAIYKIDLQAGALTQAVSLAQTSYTGQQQMPQASQEDIEAVYIPESGRIELLWAYSTGRGRCESLTFKDMTKERETITLRGVDVDPWLKEQVTKFNNSNDKYHIAIKTVSYGGDVYDFRVNTGIEIATGKGPEILYGELMLESVSGMIEKGVLMDLAPLMAEAGIKEEDYFPLAFRWREGDAIYGIFYEAAAKDCLIKADVLGGVEDPDIETLLDAMLAYPERACFDGGGASAKNVLRDFLYASDSLYGMVDWEAGTCDFSGDLMPKLLEVAKKYEYWSSEAEVTKDRITRNAYVFPSREECEAEGYVPFLYLFDDGRHPVLYTGMDRTLCINANSAHPEAAWEFLSFVLSEEAQKTIYTYGGYHLPVMKEAFFSGGQSFINRTQEIAQSLSGVDYEPPRANVEGLAEFLEDAREYPWKTEPIVELIVEEAAGYFSGGKDIRQVLELAQNRVQLYLDERGGSR